MPPLELATKIVADLCGQFDNGPVASRLLQFLSDLFDLESQGGAVRSFSIAWIALNDSQHLERPLQVVFEVGRFELERLDAFRSRRRCRPADLLRRAPDRCVGCRPFRDRARRRPTALRGMGVGRPVPRRSSNSSREAAPPCTSRASRCTLSSFTLARVAARGRGAAYESALDRALFGSRPKSTSCRSQASRTSIGRRNRRPTLPSGDRIRQSAAGTNSRPFDGLMGCVAWSRCPDLCGLRATAATIRLPHRRERFGKPQLGEQIAPDRGPSRLRGGPHRVSAAFLEPSTHRAEVPLMLRQIHQLGHALGGAADEVASVDRCVRGGAADLGRRLFRQRAIDARASLRSASAAASCASASRFGDGRSPSYCVLRPTASPPQVIPSMA